SGMLRKRLHQLQAYYQLRAHPCGVVWMDRDSSDHRWPALGGLHRPATAFWITPDLHDPGHTHIGGQPDRLSGLEAGLGLRGIEMAVRIDNRHWQRIRQGGQLHALTVSL